MSDGKENISIPSLEEIEAERSRLKRKRISGRGIVLTLLFLIAATAAAILISYLYFSVIRICGTSMEPNLSEGDIVFCMRSEKIGCGDIIAFYHGNTLLLKRVVGVSLDWIDIDKYGTVYVNGQALSESYLTNKAYGETALQYPYQVPRGKLFVLGDNREISIDSRNSGIGCIGSAQLSGKVLLRIWPLDKFGKVE